MLFIKKLFKLVKPSRQNDPGENNHPTPGTKITGNKPITCENQKSGWAKKRIPLRQKDLDSVNIDIES
jgi:hypothetical protein